MEWHETDGQNIGVELHDSELVAISQEGADLVLTLSPAWIHRSVGEPGRDPGTSWTRDVFIRLDDGRFQGCREIPDFPAWIVDGKVCVDDFVFENVLWILFDLDGYIFFYLSFSDGSKAEFFARRIRIDLVGGAQFMGEWPPGPGGSH